MKIVSRKRLLTFLTLVLLLLIIVVNVILSSSNRTSNGHIEVQLIDQGTVDKELPNELLAKPSNNVRGRLIASGFLTKLQQNEKPALYSKDGSFKCVTWSLEDQPASEDYTGVAFLNDQGEEIWRGVVGSKLCLSNNHRNFTAEIGTGGIISFYDIQRGTKPLNKVYVGYEDYRFTEDGDFFVAVGRHLALYTENGELVWRKDTGTNAPKRLAVSYDGSRITFVSNAGMSHDNPPNLSEVIETKTIQRRDDTLSQEKLMEIKRSVKDKRKSISQSSQKEPLVNQQALVDKSKSYLTTVDKQGNFVSQISVEYPVIDNIAFNPSNASQVLVTARTALLSIDIDQQQVSWVHEGENKLTNVISFDISNDGQFIAFSITTNVNRSDAQRKIYILNDKGSVLKTLESFAQDGQIRANPIITFGETNEYLIVRLGKERRIYKLIETQ